MPKFEIMIEEILRRTVTQEADSLEEAINIVEDKYAIGKIVLDSNDFVDFEIKEDERFRGF